MIEQIFPDLFKIEVPLPNSPLKALNSYLIKGKERSLIIDTGMNREECLDPMLASLKELDVDLNRTDFFITHLHADHLGQVGKLSTEDSKIYFNETEARVVTAEKDQAEVRFKHFFQFYVANGFPEEELEKAFAGHPGKRFSLKQQLEFSIVTEGDILEVGDYSLRCIETPGHSPGHMCLYDDDKKILISGDHILFKITPNITCWPELGNSLKAYLDSLDKVSTLDVNLVLPGHRNNWTEHQKRIEELHEHHENRLAEVIVALEDGDKSAWEIAPYVRWDIKVSSWEAFPVVQKWFALGETLAHIRFLEAEGKVVQKSKNGKVIYALG